MTSSGCPKREKIEEKVQKNKGITFSELKEELNLENGVLQYHIQKSDRIERRKEAILMKNACKDCKFKENCRNKCHSKILREPLKKEILEGLAQGKTQIQIAEEQKLDKTTISYHIKQLNKQGVIENKEPVESVKKHLGLS